MNYNRSRKTAPDITYYSLGDKVRITVGPFSFGQPLALVTNVTRNGWVTVHRLDPPALFYDGQSSAVVRCSSLKLVEFATPIPVPIPVPESPISLPAATTPAPFLNLGPSHPPISLPAAPTPAPFLNLGPSHPPISLPAAPTPAPFLNLGPSHPHPQPNRKSSHAPSQAAILFNVGDQVYVFSGPYSHGQLPVSTVTKVTRNGWITVRLPPPFLFFDGQPIATLRSTYLKLVSENEIVNGVVKIPPILTQQLPRKPSKNPPYFNVLTNQVVVPVSIILPKNEEFSIKVGDKIGLVRAKIRESHYVVRFADGDEVVAKFNCEVVVV